MFDFLAKIVAHVLSWLFVIGMAGTVLLVIPVAAYQLFSVLFQKDHPDEIRQPEHHRRDGKLSRAENKRRRQEPQWLK